MPSIIAHQKTNQLADVLSAAESSRGLLLLDQSAGGLLDGDIVTLGDDLDLLLNQRSQDEARTYGVDSHSLLGVLQGYCLSEADDSVFGSNVGRFVERGNQAMYGSDVDNASPTSLLHVGEGGLGEVEGRAEIEGNDLLPLGIGEVGHLIDVLHTRITDQYIHSSEILDSLFDDLFAVSRLGEISEDELGLYLGVLLSEVGLSVLDLLLGREAIQHHVVSPGSQRVGDAETDTTEGTSNEGSLVVVSG